MLQVASGSRVSGSFIAALEVLHQGDMTAAGAAVASLAWQQLHALPTSLLWDLAWLVQDGVQQQDAAQVQLFGVLLRHYVQVRGVRVCVVTLCSLDRPHIGLLCVSSSIKNGFWQRPTAAAGGQCTYMKKVWPKGSRP